MKTKLIEHCIPIRGDMLAAVRLPHNLTVAEAERIKRVVDALVNPAPEATRAGE